MANAPVRGGLLALKIDGKTFDAVGNFTWNLGLPLRAPLIGASGVDGYSEAPQAAFIEGEIRDGSEVTIADLVGATGVTASLELANGKTLVLAEAWYEGEGTGNTQEGNFPIRLVSRQQGQFV